MGLRKTGLDTTMAIQGLSIYVAYASAADPIGMPETFLEPLLPCHASHAVSEHPDTAQIGRLEGRV